MYLTRGTNGVSFTVMLFILHLENFYVKGNACPGSVSQTTLPMCQYGEKTGKGIYLDTSSFSGVAGRCTCTMWGEGTGGSVTFDPVTMDKSNCDTSLSIDSFSYVHDCNISGTINGFLHLGTSVNLTLEGHGQVDICLKMSTEAAEMTLNVTCYEREDLPTTTSEPISTTTTITTATTTTLPPVSGQICNYTDYPVLSMCKYQQVSGKGFYFDTSEYDEMAGICTCTLKVVGSEGSLNFNPVVIDTTNCQTTLAIDRFSYVHACASNGPGNGYLQEGSVVTLTLSGQGEARDCMHLYTQTPGMTLDVLCDVPTPASSTQITTPLPPPTTPVITRRSCPGTTLPVVNMCQNQVLEDVQKFYLDTAQFSSNFTKCTCTVEVISQSGGTLEIYPYTVDSSNCDTSMTFSGLEYHVGCVQYAHASNFLFSRDTMDVEVGGLGAAGICVLLQAKAKEVKLQVNCDDGVIRTVESTTTTTTSTTTTTKPPTTTTTTTTTTTPSPPPTTTTLPTTTTTHTIQTPPPPTTTTPTIPSTTTTTTTMTTTTTPQPTTTIPQTTPTQPPTVPPTTTPTTTTVKSTLSASTSIVTDNVTVSERPPINRTEKQDFPVMEVVVGIVGAMVFIFLCATIILCCRKHRYKKEKLEREQKNQLYGVPNPGLDMIEVTPTMVENPIYRDDAQDSDEDDSEDSEGIPNAVYIANEMYETGEVGIANSNFSDTADLKNCFNDESPPSHARKYVEGMIRL